MESKPPKRPDEIARWRDSILEAIGANPEAMALLQFAVSDEFDDLARALES